MQAIWSHSAFITIHQSVIGLDILSSTEEADFVQISEIGDLIINCKPYRRLAALQLNCTLIADNFDIAMFSFMSYFDDHDTTNICNAQMKFLYTVACQLLNQDETVIRSRALYSCIQR